MEIISSRRRGGSSAVIIALGIAIALFGGAAYAQDIDALKKDAAETGQEALDKATGHEKKASEKVENVQIPKGAVVLVILDTEINSKKTKIGDEIEAHLSSADDTDIFPKKTVFLGKIAEISAKSASGPGGVTARFTQAILPNGTKVEIEAVPRPLKSEGASKDAAPQKRKGGIAGKAAIGALAGTAIAGNNTTGAIVGGTVTAAAVGGKRNKEAAAEAAKTVDIVIKEATKFELVFAKSFVLKKSVSK